MDVPLLEPLARFTSDFHISDRPATSDERLFTTICDWSSALLAGLGHPLYPSYLTALAPISGEIGPANIVGQPHGYTIASAAAANAAISHFWEVDDAHRESTTHPGITVIPAVIALAQAFPEIPTSRVRSAIIVGYEAVLRIGSFLGSDHYAVCHTTATAGTFGAAAASAHLLDLDVDRTLWAFGHAGTQAQGLWQLLDDDASEAKGFHAAVAVRNGISSAMMARAGIKGATRILEGRRGMLAAWHLRNCDLDWLRPGDNRMIDTVTVKNWPTCGQMHSTLDCAVQIYEAGSYAVPDIISVNVEIPKACTDIADVQVPETLSAAKFSTSFCVAATLAGRKPDLQGLQPTLLADTEVRNLASRVSLTIDPGFSARFPRERPARVTVTLADGNILSAERAFRKGDPEAPWTRSDLIARTRDVLALADRSLDVDTLIDWCDRFADPKCSEWSPNQLFSLANLSTPLHEAIS
ncbi:MmgE/PrpD family protein [Billgrantia endophytica]|uniref:2-methylcitrate dehydratase n=1 Tax=Billgrantia endophytica TaxID=2033802 RepID=A0A2N7UEC5_9GAMM|nr:MmgE/PrpD family protein [Halomonas endophytica]PMR78770.1 2-methylcitrate dehydratase [Halomonas endophytica]